MKTIRFNIPKEYKPLDIKEFSEGGQHYIEVDLIAKKDMCTNHLPHKVDVCEKCKVINK